MKLNGTCGQDLQISSITPCQVARSTRVRSGCFRQIAAVFAAIWMDDDRAEELLD
ncbi:MAG: hypothetical protein VKL01_09265 [Limnothrix sp.]|nr:hypothetical protein [Limnothrix sp.]